MIKTFNISLPEDLVKDMDKYAKLNYMSRSELIKHSVIKELHNSKTVWAEVIDFTKINKNGASAQEVLKAIKKIDNDR